MRKPEVILVGIVLVMLLPSINALQISPSWVEFTGNAGDWQSKNITIINDENKTVNVTIEPSSAISDCYISRPKITLGPDEQTEVTIGMQLTSPKHGFIFYTYNGQQINQFILLTPSGKNVSVDMIPAQPKAGGTIVFMLEPYDVRGAGFVYVVRTNRIYNFTIINGLAFVTLSQHDFGDAVAVFQGSDFQARKVFTIEGSEGMLTINTPKNVNVGEKITVHVEYAGNPLKCNVNITEPSGNSYEKKTDDYGNISLVIDTAGEWKFKVSYKGMDAEATLQAGGGGQAGNLMIAAPSDIHVGDKKTITVVSGVSPASNADVMIQYPDGSVKMYQADANGQVTVNFTMAGSYHITASYGGNIASKNVNVEKGQLQISFPTGFVGQTVVIPAPANAKVEITHGSKTITGTASYNGYAFVPDSAGIYEIHVETNDGKADGTVTVYETTNIEIYDSHNNPVVNGIAGKQYTIHVVDSNGNPVDIGSVKIVDSKGNSISLSLNGGIGTWIPKKAGQYYIESPTHGIYWKATKTIIIQEGGGNGYIYAIALAIIIAIAVIVRYRDKIFSRFRKEENIEESEELE